MLVRDLVLGVDMQLSLSRSPYILLLAVFISLGLNSSFYQKHADIYPWAENVGFNLSVVGLNTLMICLLLAMLNLLLPFRLLAIVILFVSASASYFADYYGVIIDTGMLQNVAQTNANEATELLNLGLLLHFCMFAILPALLISKCELKKSNKTKELSCIFAWIIFTPMTAALLVLSFSDHYANFFRQHKHIRSYANPAYPIYSAIKLAAEQLKQPVKAEFIQLTQNITTQAYRLPRLTIMVVGETVRADHLSLNGYNKVTMPLLGQEQGLVNFPRVKACATSTAVSVPCMFSLYNKSQFDLSRSRYTENVLDVLAQAGVAVLWRDNNSSSKGVADRLVFESFKDKAVNPNCDIECRDPGMLAGLETYISQQPADILIVLHQMGNHGPAYYKRYPKAFAHFQPTCETSELSRCSQLEISNAYDNAIRYTDYFLSRVINLLRAFDDTHATSMLYVSDHGESLGEKGLYLHGMPYAFAPDSQIQVPVLLWAGMQSPVDPELSAQQAGLDFSHDQVSPSLLKMFGVEIDLPGVESDKRSFVQLKKPS